MHYFVVYYNTLCYDIGVRSNCEALRMVDGAESIYNSYVLPRLVAERYKRI